MSAPITTHDAPCESAKTAVELVVAVSENDVIGRGNALPWRLSDDLRRFKSLTLDKCVLMGRKTFESIGKALPGRTNLVLTRTKGFIAPDCVLVDSVPAAQRQAEGRSPLMVIGGAEIYRQCISFATCIHLTLVHADVAGDAFFDGWHGGEWRESSREWHAADSRNDSAYSFITLRRI